MSMVERIRIVTRNYSIRIRPKVPKLNRFHAELDLITAMLLVSIIDRLQYIRFICTLYLDADGCQGAGRGGADAGVIKKRLNSRPYHILAGAEGGVGKI